MWLTYVDESGNTGKKLDDPDQPFHVLVGVSVREDVVGNLAAYIDGIAARQFGTAARTKATELHASQLKGGNGAFAGVPVADRLAVYRAVLEPLAWDGVFVSHATINKPGLAARGDTRSPHLWALQFLVEKLNQCFRGSGEHTLLVADETMEHEQFALDLLASLQSGHPDRGLNFGATSQVVDTVHFVRSETNRGVQLADLVAYLLGRRRRSVSAPVEDEMWADLVSPHQKTWREVWP